MESGSSKTTFFDWSSNYSDNFIDTTGSLSACTVDSFEEICLDGQTTAAGSTFVCTSRLSTERQKIKQKQLLYTVAQIISVCVKPYLNGSALNTVTSCDSVDAGVDGAHMQCKIEPNWSESGAVDTPAEIFSWLCISGDQSIDISGEYHLNGTIIIQNEVVQIYNETLISQTVTFADSDKFTTYKSCTAVAISSIVGLIICVAKFFGTIKKRIINIKKRIMKACHGIRHSESPERCSPQTNGLANIQINASSDQESFYSTLS